MNSLRSTHRASLRRALFLISLALTCFALSTVSRAVSPPPDGGYANFTTAEGTNALHSLTTGSGNTGIGYVSLFSVTDASYNTGVGAGTLALNTAASNTAVGALALLQNVAGGNNTAVGTFAGFNISGSSANVTVGTGSTTSGAGITTGSNNTVVGDQAGLGIASANNTTIIGNNAGGNPFVLNNCIYIGQNVGTGFSALESNTIRIGDNLPTGGGASQCFIGGIAGQTVNPSGAAGVVIDNDGKLGVFLSSQRFKRDVEPMNKTSEAILGLKPVTFHYKSDAKNTPCFGLIAEEVAKVDPALVVRDKDGKPYTVRYEAVNAMLLNEFLKEHQTVQELRKQIAELTAGLQKVSDQLEMSKSAPQTVLNNR